ncbi:MAG: ParB/RepB/Spo0J family partition protein [Acidobacteriaceae bacterium]|nr:ParB/RepB/Spo0J family partition protein [Acidobacteriaceae bacterium]
MNTTAEVDGKRRALGRGLESLLPNRPLTPPATVVRTAPETAIAAAEVPTEGRVQQIPLDMIDRNPWQTRTRMDDAALEELAASIRSSGVLQPIVVRYIANRYQLIAGERRWLASQRAGMSTIPAIVRAVSNEQAMEMTIIENLQREDLNPMEQARAFDRLSREFGLTQEQMAQRTGKERASVANFMRLLKLPLEVQSEVESGALSFGHAKVLLMLDSAEAQTEVAKRVIEGALSVRQTEDLVYKIVNPTEKPSRPERQVDPNVREAEREIQRILGVQVRISDRQGKGKIVLEYATLEDFDRILAALKG